MTPKQRRQHYQITKGRKINQEDYTYVDTKRVQLNSLISFMTALGYDYCPSFNNTFAARYKEGFKGCEILSLNTAVNLHNAVWENVPDLKVIAPKFSFVRKFGGGYFPSTFFLDTYTLNMATGSKIVSKVCLHSGKNGVLLCYKQQVRWVDTRYEDLFLEKENAQ